MKLTKSDAKLSKNSIGMIHVFGLLLVIALITLFSGQTLAWVCEPFQFGDKIFFGLPFDCGRQEGGKIDPTGKTCLADGFNQGLAVVLINNQAPCLATTAEQSTYELHDGQPFTITQIVGYESCPGPFFLAVVSDKPASVETISTDSNAVLPKELETEALKLMKERESAKTGRNPSRESDEPEILYYTLDGSITQTWTVGGTTLIQFGLREDVIEGPIALFMNNKFFLLEGRCTISHTFFSVNGKLHLAYWAIGCGSGARMMCVYEIANLQPRLVYANGELSS